MGVGEFSGTIYGSGGVQWVVGEGWWSKMGGSGEFSGWWVRAGGPKWGGAGLSVGEGRGLVVQNGGPKLGSHMLGSDAEGGIE